MGESRGDLFRMSLFSKPFQGVTTHLCWVRNILLLKEPEKKVLTGGTRVANLKIFSFPKINFYAILRYVEQDSEIYFSEKIYRLCLLKIINQQLFSIVTS